MRTLCSAIVACVPLGLLLSACAGDGGKKKKFEDDEAAAVAFAERATGEPATTMVDDAVPARALGEVEQAFAARADAFRRVNSARVSQNAGTFEVALTFAAAGEIVECRMLSTDFPDDPAFNAAVMAEVWRVRIAPRTDVGEFVVSRYPIVFSARTDAHVVPPPLAP